MVDEMVARGCRHLVLTTIYPVYDMQRIEYMVTTIPTRVSKTWAVTAPILNLMNSHIRAEAKRVGAKVVDLYHSDIEPNDIVFGIEPGALTANEAQYIAGFRSVDALRNRLVAAEQEIDRRLRSKGITRSSQAEES